MDKFIRLHKRLAKKAGVPTKIVKSIWEQKRQELVESGVDESKPLFVQDLATLVKEELGVEENFIALDRFKKFL